MQPLLASALLLTLALFPSTVLAQDAGNEELASTEAFELGTILRDAHSVDAEVLGRRIASRGHRIAPHVFLALREGTCPVTENGSMLIGEPELEVLRSATRRLGRSRFASLFPTSPADELDEETRQAILQVLAEVGNRQDCSLTMKLVLTEQEPSARLNRAFEQALGGILARHEGAVRSLGRQFLELSSESAYAATRAVARTPSHDGLDFLVGMVGYRESDDSVLLSFATSIALELDGPFDQGMTAKARVSLGDTDFQIARQAACLMASLQDFESSEDLVVLLSHEKKGVRQAAQWALRELTGLNLRPDAGGWSAWLDKEMRWFEEVAPDQRKALAEGSPVQVAEAMRELSRHRYERHRSALDIAQVLQHENHHLRRQACIVLRQLDSRAPVEQLIESLNDEEAIAIEAHRTLLMITGAKLPLDVEAWRELSS